MYRAFSSAIEASEKDKWPPNVATIRVTRPKAPRLLQESNPTETQQRLESRCGSGIACGKRGHRKDEFKHVIDQQTDDSRGVVFLRFFHDAKLRFYRFIVERLEDGVLVRHSDLLRFAFCCRTDAIHV